MFPLKGARVLSRRRCWPLTNLGSGNVTSGRKISQNEDNLFPETALVSKDPLRQFENWLDHACSVPAVPEANAMTLATVKANGSPSARVVLLKDYDQTGFKFYTSYRSAKAGDIESTPYAALVFFWTEVSRSIRIEGQIEKLPDCESDDYFAKRPRASQISTHASENQSAPVRSRSTLTRRKLALEGRYQGESVPRPRYWGGYVVKPDMMEFWQWRRNRKHDKIVFNRKENTVGESLHEGENGWVYQLL